MSAEGAASSHPAGAFFNGLGRYRNHRVSGTQEVKGRGIVHANPKTANDGRIPFDNKGLTISL
jgi:hypothetical protein